jgi:ribosomal-protein-alanine N-acetyltransferase
MSDKVSTMKENINIRNACLADVDAIMEIEYACFERGVMESREVFKNRIRLFPEGFLVVDDQISSRGIAYLSSELWEKRYDGKYYFTLDQPIEKKHNANGAVYYISSMGVLPDYRGKGIGSRLFERSLKVAGSLGCMEAILIVGETWNHAQAIYTKQGFSVLYKLKEFFHPEKDEPYDAIVMWREL